MDAQENGLTSRRKFLTLGLGTAAMWALGASEAMAWTRPTIPQVLGPYHRKNAPFRTTLADAAEPGERLIVKGRVTDTDGKPLKGAVVDVWQADEKGQYDNDGHDHAPDPSEFHLRGQMRTNDQGEYEYETILPGLYDMAPGQKRPRHIHYIVSSPGYVPITTQLYFKGDPYIKNDPFARPELVIVLDKELPSRRFKNGVLHGTFDVVLAKPGN